MVSSIFAEDSSNKLDSSNNLIQNPLDSEAQLSLPIGKSQTLEKTSIEKIQLRNYQQKLKTDIYDAIRKGFNRILVYSPTGSGKTFTFSAIIVDAISKKRKILLLVHRDFLVSQSIESLIILGIDREDIGVIKAGYEENRSRPIQIASIQTLQNRAIPHADVIIIDETHSLVFWKTYQNIVEHNPKAIKMGFSASPWRLKPHEEYFGLHYDTIVFGPSIALLINQGYLSPVRYYGWGGIVDIRKLEINSGGEFKERQMQQAYIDEEVHLDIRDKILEHCQNRTGIIFNAGVQQSQITTECLNKAGIITRHIDAKTPVKERWLIFQALEKGKIRCISSIGCLTEGFDVKSISFIVFARATKSKALYYQIAGRGIRIAEGKKDCLILDFGGNIKRHGFLTQNQPITLDPEPKPEEEPPTKECPNCHAVISQFAHICPECGHVFDGMKPPLDDSEFEKQFGEMFDPETRKIVNYARGQRKRRYTKNEPPDRLWETFNQKYKEKLLRNEWLLGSVFASESSEANRQRFLEYLNGHAPEKYLPPTHWTYDPDHPHQLNPVREQWIKHHLELEFGQPGQTYQIGVREYKTGKIGSTSQLDWWEVLQVSPTATQELIESNYRELIRVYSYSQLDNATIQEKITLLHWAYEKGRRLSRCITRTPWLLSEGTQSAPLLKQLSSLDARPKSDCVDVASAFTERSARSKEILPKQLSLFEGGDVS